MRRGQGQLHCGDGEKNGLQQRAVLPAVGRAHGDVKLKSGAWQQGYGLHWLQHEGCAHVCCASSLLQMLHCLCQDAMHQHEAQ